MRKVLSENMSASQECLLWCWLLDIPAKDLRGLGRIVLVTKETEARYVGDLGYELIDGELFDAWGEGFVGMYNYPPGKDPEVLLCQRGFMRTVLLHEIGHHATIHDEDLVDFVQRRITDELWRIYRELDSPRPTFKYVVKLLAEMSGVSVFREYTFSSAKEFLADAYVVLRIGSEQDKDRLYGFWECIAPNAPSIGWLIEEGSSLLKQSTQEVEQ